MKKLYVYADFDWLKEVEFIGELGYESFRGSDSYSFKFPIARLKSTMLLLSAMTLTTIRAFNIPGPKRIFSVVLPMLSPTDGDVHFCFVENKFWHKKRTAQFAVFRHLIS